MSAQHHEQTDYGLDVLRGLAELKGEIGSLHTKLDANLKHHEERIGVCVQETQDIKARMKCDVHAADIDRLKGDRRWLTDKAETAICEVTEVESELKGLQATVEQNAIKNKEQEDRHDKIMGRVWAVLVTVIAGVIYSYIKTHWK